MVSAFMCFVCVDVFLYVVYSLKGYFNRVIFSKPIATMPLVI